MKPVMGLIVVVTVTLVAGWGEPSDVLLSRRASAQEKAAAPAAHPAPAPAGEQVVKSRIGPGARCSVP
jgi:hypothetical protein